MTSLEELFCHIDDFCQVFEPQWQHHLIGQGVSHRKRSRSLSLSEILTILVSFHQQGDRNFKTYYLKHVCQHWKADFPELVSYNRFIEWVPSTVIPLCVYLQHCFGACNGISFIDATALKVCHNRRITRLGSLMASRLAVKPRWIGSLVSSYTLLSMSMVNCSISP